MSPKLLITSILSEEPTSSILVLDPQSKTISEDSPISLPAWKSGLTRTGLNLSLIFTHNLMVSCTLINHHIRLILAQVKFSREIMERSLLKSSTNSLLLWIILVTPWSLFMISPMTRYSCHIPAQLMPHLLTADPCSNST